MFVALEFNFAKTFEEFFNETLKPILIEDIYMKHKKEYEMNITLVFSEVRFDMLLLRPS